MKFTISYHDAAGALICSFPSAEGPFQTLAAAIPHRPKDFTPEQWSGNVGFIVGIFIADIDSIIKGIGQRLEITSTGGAITVNHGWPEPHH